jgi:hypothetical protein
MKPYLAALRVTGDQGKIAATVSYLTAVDATTWWTDLKSKPTAWKEFKALFSRFVIPVEAEYSLSELVQILPH